MITTPNNPNSVNSLTRAILWNTAKTAAPGRAQPRTSYPVTNPVNDPDALRPGSANDPRNKSRIDPMHISAGTGE